jgi:hypothetical protein
MTRQLKRGTGAEMQTSHKPPPPPPPYGRRLFIEDYGERGGMEVGNGQWVGCPRKCFFYFRRNTEFLGKHTEFRGIPYVFAYGIPQVTK